MSKKTNELQPVLEKELQRLTAKLGLNLDLKVVWVHNKAAGLSGEVKEGSIYIYEVEEEKAIQTLKHELIDYMITSRIVRPLVSLVNMLIKAREAEIYEEKEKLVEIFSKII
ncbi:hypothetical protein KEJ37_00390 [Candidatus Bathyarchaeota archaeon]|nr:hypothetical protein [Candidatus Bathyarchaeota archaeon]